MNQKRLEEGLRIFAEIKSDPHWVAKQFEEGLRDVAIKAAAEKRATETERLRHRLIKGRIERRGMLN